MSKWTASIWSRNLCRISGSVPAVVIAGDHFIFYVDPSGRAVDEPGRITGNALVFQRGGLTVRIEANLPMEQLAAVARLMS